MNACIRIWILAIGLAALPGCAESPKEAMAPTPELVVATYNLRFASPSGPNSWPERRALVSETVRLMSPDLMGTQEGLQSQLNDMATDLPEYHWIGLGRDGENRGEFMAVFYRTNRFQPLSTNHFWLSDTPEIPGSASWGNRARRMVTSVRFQDASSGHTVDFYNTHLDHEVAVARSNSASLIRQRLETNDAQFLILVGDFNCPPITNGVYDVLTGDKFLSDTWVIADRRAGEGMGTFNGFRSMPTNGARIDWILTRGFTAASTAIVTNNPDGRWPSDHFPVVSRMRYSQPR